jgi:hypothetical protein
MIRGAPPRDVEALQVVDQKSNGIGIGRRRRARTSMASRSTLAGALDKIQSPDKGANESRGESRDEMTDGWMLQITGTWRVVIY